ncbi:cupin domain-containing protein [Chlorogloeopsis fritschii PCC 9212]|nr:cupin domain-containing protein [Chlorogloeopsis fritschii]
MFATHLDVETCHGTSLQCLMPPGTSEIRHYHQRSRQFFFVLSGEATIEIAGKRQVLRQHEGVEVSPGIPHQIFNKSGQDLEFLVA